MKTNRLFALGLVLALAGGACGDDSGGGGTSNQDGGPGPGTNPDGGPGPNPDGGPGPTPDGGPMTNPDGGNTDPVGTGSATLNSNGGSVTSTDGRLTLTFSRYALTRPTKVTISVATPAPAGAQGTVYNIEPKQESLGTNNNPTIKVTLKYTAADLGGGSAQDLKVGQFRGGKWVELTGIRGRDGTATKANPTAMEVSAFTTQLGPVALLSGICVSCPTECTPANCVFGEQKTAGQCVDTGNGCKVCRPVCDGDLDGFCLSGVGGAPGGDCNDADKKVRPNGAVFGSTADQWPELCNGIDDNCQNGVDEGCTACKGDADCTIFGQYCKSGFCDVGPTGCDASNCGTLTSPGKCVAFGRTNSSCVPLCDVDGDGQCQPTVMNPNGDCNEMDRNVNSGAPEICGNNIDDDCNGAIDDLCNTCATDADCPADGLQCVAGVCTSCAGAASCDPAVPSCQLNGQAGTCGAIGKGCFACLLACDGDKDGACANNGDCDDSDPTIRANQNNYPDTCGDGIDNNCNGHKDEGCTACAADSDCKATQENCKAGSCQVCDNSCTQDNCRWPMNQPAIVPTVAGRCAPAGTACNKCVPPEDADGDGFVTAAVHAKYLAAAPSIDLPRNFDCNDADPNVRPSTEELPWLDGCGNMVDDNCDGVVDELCTSCATSMMCGPPGACNNTR